MPKRLSLSLSLYLYHYIISLNEKIPKYVVLLFSDCNNKPSKHFKPIGFGGFRHNEYGYLQKLPVIAKYLNRQAVFAPPWISLSGGHNLGKQVNKNHTWGTYLNMSNIDNVETNAPFSFSNNGDIETDLSVAYYPSDTPLDKMDNNVDIIALVNYNDAASKRYIYSHLTINNYRNYPLVKYSTSNLLKNYAATIISKQNLDKFTFIHIRRGDYLDNSILAPPAGVRPYTSPGAVSNFIKTHTLTKTIIIATNERDLNYKNTLVNLLDNYTIIFEEELQTHLPPNIFNNNYMAYLILHEIAKKAKINIGTVGYVRLGDACDYKLCDYKPI